MAQEEWHYGIAGQQYGPVTWELLRAMAQQGQLDRGHLVWREGMAGWVQAQSVPGLFDEVPIRILPTAYAAPVDAARERLLRNARRHAVTIFSLLIGESILVAGFWNAVLRKGGAWSASWGVWSWTTPVVWLGAIYAAVCMAYRGQHLRQLPRTFRILAWVGGLGLIAMLAVHYLLGAILR